MIENGKGKIIMAPSGSRNQVTAEEVIQMRPLPITAREMMEGGEWNNITDDVQIEKAKGEMMRWFLIYESHRAFFQGSTNGSVLLYHVQFPGSEGKYKSGPKHPTAWQALMENVRLNKFFPGEDAVKQATYGQDAVEQALADAIDIDAAIDRYNQKQDEHLEDTIRQATQRKEFNENKKTA